jgi:Zn-dependent M16 (insulinase) family peptidase
VQPQLTQFLEELPVGAARNAVWNLELQPHSEGLVIPAQVNYVAKGANLFTLGYQEDGSADVINHYLRTTYLWEKVRVQGGAYGGFCLFDRLSGVFTFVSYRDPNLLKTVRNYNGAASFLKNIELSQEELTRAIIGVIGVMDDYQLPDAKGYTSLLRYLMGETDELRQQRREQVLGASQQDFRAFGEVLSRLNEAGQVVVLGSQAAIDMANQERPGWLQVRRVL